jgi:hypothetical protein
VGFWRAGWAAFWLLQGEGDRDADEVEGLVLGAGGLGEHWHGDGGPGEPDLAWLTLKW